MKNTVYILGLLFLVFGHIACDDDDTPTPEECVEVSYNQAFEAIPETTYCLEDSSTLFTTALMNNLCPCDAECIWEGEITVDLAIETPDTTFDYTLHGDTSMQTGTLPEGWTISFSNVVFDEPCSDSNPLPSVESVELLISN